MSARIPELLSPAGNARKLKVAYDYGADAAYIGVSPFSLRKACEGESADSEISKPVGKKLYGALNMLFYDQDITLLEQMAPQLGKVPYDAFIVSDLGAARVLRERLPDVDLHLSTQSSCMNSCAVREYASLGFKRIILGREASIDDIRRIKDKAGDIEIEVFVHGAMCMAVSGRCLLSAALSARSGNRGDCTQPCRWKYRLALEEESRPGQYMPFFEDGNFSTILSSRDLCMINHLQDLVDAGVDSLKIEGRMKSMYYVAVVTRSYRHMLDAVLCPDASARMEKVADCGKYVSELENVSHREYTTGFFYGDERYGFSPARGNYISNYRFLGVVGKRKSPGVFEVEAKYKIEKGQTIELIGPEVFSIAISDFVIYDQEMNEKNQANINSISYLKFGDCDSGLIREGFLIRGRI